MADGLTDGINVEVFQVAFVHENVKYVTVFVFANIFKFNSL